jgi:uncharacterized membrane protein YfcA
MIDTTLLVDGVLVCFLAGVVGGMSGAGTGIVITGFLTPILGAKAVMPALSIIMLFNNASRVYFYRDSIDWRASFSMAVLALPGSWFGTRLYMQLSSRSLEILLGMAILTFLVIRFLRARYIPRTSSSAISIWMYGLGALVSIVYGFLNSMVPGSGILILGYLRSISMPVQAMIATDALISLVLNVGKTVMFRQLDGLPDSLALMAMIFGIVSVPSVLFAKWLSSHFHPKLQVGIVEAVIVLSAANILLRPL